jgi:hypothetical protein
MQEFIGSIGKNGKERVEVAFKEYKGREFLDIRIYYLDENDEMRPTGKGVTLKPDQISDLISLLSEAQAKI